MTQRVQLDHVLLDVDFLHKPSVKALRFKHGALAALYYIELSALMSRATGAVILPDTALSAASDCELSIDKAQAILDYCVERGLLRKSDDGYTSDRVIADQEKLARRREQINARVIKHRSNALVTQSNRDCNALHDRYTCVTPDTVTDTGSDLGSNDLGSKSSNALRAPAFIISDHGTVDLGELQKAQHVATQRLTFDSGDLAALIMNHYHGNASLFVADARAATDNLIKRGEPVLNSERSCAFLRTWIKNKKQFEKSVGFKKQSNIDRIKDFILETADEEGSGTKPNGDCGLGVWDEYGAIEGALEIVGGAPSINGLRSRSDSDQAPVIKVEPIRAQGRGHNPRGASSSAGGDSRKEALGGSSPDRSAAAGSVKPTTPKR